MGALVPLLLAITRTARMQAEAAAVAKQGTAAKTAELQDPARGRAVAHRATEEVARADASATGRGPARTGPSRRPLAAAASQLAQYQNTIHDLENVESSDQKRLAQSQAELDRLRAQIGTAQQQVAQAHQAAAGRRRSYAVVPYEGPNQTRRRPIYLECRADAVVLQPEGIRLTRLRISRGRWAPAIRWPRRCGLHASILLAGTQFDPQAGEPYPLLLVRPEGIAAYYAARGGNEVLGRRLRLRTGRRRLETRLSAARSPAGRRDGTSGCCGAGQSGTIGRRRAAQYGHRSTAVYHASPNGGFVREGGSSDDDDRGYRSASPAGAVGQNRGAGGGGLGTGSGQGTNGQGGQGPGGGQGTGGGQGGSGSAAANPYLAATGGSGSNPGGSVFGGGCGGWHLRRKHRQRFWRRRQRQRRRRHGWSWRRLGWKWRQRGRGWVAQRVAAPADLRRREMALPAEPPFKMQPAAALLRAETCRPADPSLPGAGGPGNATQGSSGVGTGTSSNPAGGAATSSNGQPNTASRRWASRTSRRIRCRPAGSANSPRPSHPANRPRRPTCKAEFCDRVSGSRRPIRPPKNMTIRTKTTTRQAASRPKPGLEAGNDWGLARHRPRRGRSHATDPRRVLCATA